MSKINKIQSLLGVSKSEFTVVSIIFAGLLIGLLAQKFYYDDNSGIDETVYKALDSLAEIQKTTYTGTDIYDNPRPELAAGDTLVKKKKGFAKKKLPQGKINLNTASKLELMKLPGVGESTAIKILEYREKNSFSTPSDIMKIKGIGKKKYEKMSAFIEVR